MKRIVLVLSVLLLSGAAFGQTRAEEEAGDVSEVDKDAVGPLRDRVPPVSGFLFLKRGRFEASPGVSVSVKDAFFTKYILGASLTYHPIETFGIGVRVGYSIPTVSSAAQICFNDPNDPINPPGCRAPRFHPEARFPEELDRRAPGQISLVAFLDAQWAPIYGKVSLAAQTFLNFDLYAIGGAGVVQYVGPAGAEFGGIIDGVPLALNLGLGSRVIINRWLTVRLEVRDLLYIEKSTLPAPNNLFFRNQIVVDIGFSMFFPTAFEEG